MQLRALSCRRPDGSTAASDGGFTLIELSIVLVIIGLLVGSVLVGQDLIKAAQVRATISQIEKYNTAVNTFERKFDALPGDMTNTTAAQFGFSAANHNAPDTTTSGQGDGNGVLDGIGGAKATFVGGLAGQTSSVLTAAGEQGVFWVDLSAAGLIDANFSLATESTNATVFAQQMSQYVPTAKLGGNNYIYVFGLNGSNYFGIENIFQFWNNMAGVPSITVAQAYSIDNKIDDGFPTTGTVAAMINSGADPEDWVYGANPLTDNYVPSGSLFSGVVATAGNASSSLTCFDAAAGTQPTYSMEQNGGSGVNCALIIRFQ